MDLKLPRFITENRRRIRQVAIGFVLVCSIVWGVPELKCSWDGWSCEARRAAERHVDALANNDYESYATNVFGSSVEDFEFQLACLDWSQAKVGEVYDSTVSSELKEVALHAPSGNFFLDTALRRPEGGAREGKGFMVGVGSDTCPLDLDGLPQARGDND